MLLLEDEKYTSARDLEYGVGDMEYVWICHKGGVSINKLLCVQMVTQSRRLLHKIAFVCSPVVEWEQPQTFDQNTLTSSCCLNTLLFPRWTGEHTRNQVSSASPSVLFSSGNAHAARLRAAEFRGLTSSLYQMVHKSRSIKYFTVTFISLYVCFWYKGLHML